MGAREEKLRILLEVAVYLAILLYMSTGQNTKTIAQFKVSEETSRRLRILAIQRGCRVGEIVREIVEEYVARENRPRGRGKA